MLKWFRKYNKYILAVGASLLMVAFLMPQACQQTGQSIGDYTIGTIGAEQQELSLSDQQRAGRTVETLRRVFMSVDESMVLFAGLGGARGKDQDPVDWLLMQHEAAAMGLSAGPSQVEGLLGDLGIQTAEREQELANRLEISRDDLYAVLAEWIVIQQYKELVLGRAHLPVYQRLRAFLLGLQSYAQAIEGMQQGKRDVSYLQLQRFMQQISRVATQQGLPRVSEPAVRRYLADWLSQITVEALSLSADRHLADVPAPDEARLTELFEQYKDSMPGEGAGYGLGYRFADRVKLEFMSIPFERALKVASVDESAAVAYYDNNQGQFTEQPEPVTPTDDAADAPAPPPAEPVVKPYPQVRDQIIRQLKETEAEKLLQKMVNAARSKLAADVRSLVRKDGYRLIPDDAKWTPLDQVAQDLQRRFGVLPDVTRLDDRWLDMAALAKLEGIGGSSLPLHDRRYSFVDYVASVKELGAAEKHRLRSQALQTRVPSHALEDLKGSRYLFRLLDAQPAHSPGSLDEVRAVVESDARQLAAYQKLVDDAPTWRRRMDAASLADLGAELELEVLKPAPFQWRQFDQRRGGLVVPTVEQIGNSAAFVDAVFELGHELAQAGDDVQELPAPRRSVVIPVDAQKMLYLVRIENFESIPRSVYENGLKVATVHEDAATAVVGSDLPDPLSFEALKARVGFVADTGP